MHVRTDACLHDGVEDGAPRASPDPATTEVVAANELRHVGIREEIFLAPAVGPSTR